MKVLRLERSFPREVEYVKKNNIPLVIAGGTVEYHGPQCSYGCDSLVAEGLIEKLAEEKEAERLKVNAYNRERKQKALENGICYYCLKNKAIEGRRECLECVTKRKKESEQKAQERRATRENLRSYRLENHLCTKCGEPAKDGYKVCERHYQISIDNQKKAKEALRKTLDKWE